MKRYDLSTVSVIAQAPGKAPTFTFIQDAYKEMGEQIMIGLIGTLGVPYTQSVPYILAGGISSNATTTSVSGGALLYGGEIYTFATQSIGFTTSVFQAQVNISYDPIADPTTFSDLVPRNVHQIRTLVFTYSSSLISGNFGMSNSYAINTNPLHWTAIGNLGSFFYTNWTAAFANPPRFLIDRFQYVKLQGQAVVFGGTPGASVSNIPVGYRPPGILSFPCTQFNDGNGSYSTVNIAVSNNGQIYYQDATDLATTSTSILYLDNIGYYTMQNP